MFRRSQRWGRAIGFGFGLGLLAPAFWVMVAPGQEPAEQKAAAKPKPEGEVKAAPPWPNLFDANVKVTVADDALIVESDGIPTHPTGTFPNSSNPNRITKQAYRFQIPRVPKPAAEPTPTPMGPIGVALNGVPFYNQYNAQRRDAVSGAFAEVFDPCCGHPDPMGRYHYHKYPVCVKSPFKDPKGEHSPLIGLMFDGYALHGPNGDDGQPPKDLDASNGHEDKARGYHYHVTAKFPYLIGSYHGVVNRANLDGGGRPGPGGPMGGPGGPRPPLFSTLDLDGDGVISAEEIQKSSASLKALDRNRDGKLTPEEVPPNRPGGGPPGGRRPGGGPPIGGPPEE